jgi:hypothetical protein
MKTEQGLGYATGVQSFGMCSKATCQEIERAIDNAKRSAWDKWFRRQWYRAGAMWRRRGPSHRPRVSGARRW